MPFSLNRESSEPRSGGRQFMFKAGVNNLRFKADDNTAFSFRILPAFPVHAPGSLTEDERAGSYVPAVTMENGMPVVADWIFGIPVSRSFAKEAFPILSRKVLTAAGVENPADPLSQVIAFCRAHDKQWGYIIKDQGKWGDPGRICAKLPAIKEEYVMNIVSYNSDSEGVKLGHLSSSMALLSLLGTREGQEGIALRQTTQELTREEIEANPSVIFQYGDITDPNGAPVLNFIKTESEDGGRKVFRITVATEIDPSTGRKHTLRAGVTPEDMAARVDLTDPESYLNVPTEEEQVGQLVERCCARSADGFHEYEMLKAALPDYAGLIPDPPSAPGAINSSRGFSAPAAKTAQAASPARTFRPAPAQAQTQPRVQPQQARPQARTFRPAGANVNAQPEPAPAQESPASVDNVPGEEDFSADDWVAAWQKDQQ